ncbi:MAG: TPM domain-containing protein [Opitutaceae bacterium]
MNIFPPSLPLDHDRIVAAIGEAELLTCGEIRVLLARQPAPEPVATAQKQFDQLGMTQTTARNGVLLFLAPASRTFAIIGDTGVHEKCGEAFWRDVAAAMSAHFKRGEFTEGLVQGIERTGTLLAAHFPRAPDDRDELPNDVAESD